MIKFKFTPARDELVIVLENIHDAEYSDLNYLVKNISYYQKIINKLKDYNLNDEINNLVTIKNNCLMSLDFIDDVIHNQLIEIMPFIDISDLAMMLFKQCNVDSKVFNSIFNKFMRIANSVQKCSLESFDKQDLLQIMFKFYVLYEVYHRSIIINKYYRTVYEFYNSSNEEIFDYCCS